MIYCISSLWQDLGGRFCREHQAAAPVTETSAHVQSGSYGYTNINQKEKGRHLNINSRLFIQNKRPVWKHKTFRLATLQVTNKMIHFLTHLPLFTLWKLEHLEEGYAVVKLPELQQSQSQTIS